jgi:DNA-binding protein HU-beta
MTKAEFIQAVQVELQDDKITKTAIGKVLDAAGAVGLALLKDKSQGKVDLFGLGSLKTVNRAAREGRNPRTGAKLKIPARSGAKYTPSKAVKDALK